MQLKNIIKLFYAHHWNCRRNRIGKDNRGTSNYERIARSRSWIIAQDSYYKETHDLSYEDRSKINFDHPRAIDFELLVAHLKELKAGNTIDQPVYSFVQHNRTDDIIITHPRKVMIVEGILILTNPELRNLFDIKIRILQI